MTDPKHAHEQQRGRPRGQALSLEARFRKFIGPQANDGCWQWTGRRNRDGYGRFSIKSRWQMAHRIAHELFIGPIPEGFEVDHLCHNADRSCVGGTSCLHRLCVNPAHLEATSHKVNMHRTDYISAKVRQTHCKYDHEYTEANTGRDSRGCRKCRACDREKKARNRAARRAVAA